MNRILLLFASFFIPLLMNKKDYNLIILRFDGNKFIFNTKIFFEYLLNNTKYEVKYIINNDELRDELTKQYGPHFIFQKGIKDIIYISKAGTWLTDGGFPIKTPFGHRNRVLINFWHGLPLKKIGILGYSGLKKIRVWVVLKMFARHYTAFCTTSRNLVSVIRRSFLLREEKIKLLGQPRNDMLFKINDRKEVLEKYYGDLPEYNKIVLYAPTWRKGIYGDDWGGEDTKFFPFEDFDQELFEEYLEANKMIFFLRPHHLQELEIKESKRIRDMSSKVVEEIMEILNIFDLLITDYSSIYFDFLLVEKPVLFLPYDLEEYQSKAGLNYDYLKVTPGPKPESFKEFKEEIKKLLADENYYERSRDEINTYFNQLKRDNCHRILKFLEEEIGKVKGD